MSNPYEFHIENLMVVVYAPTKAEATRIFVESIEKYNNENYNKALEDFINKVCSLRIYDNDLTLTDLEEARKQLMK